ncbi:glycosyltransferase [Proteiniclasticum ruminis]|uniref:glycosyltransferase n=1 Tax=Proteiniclasticum ruminis TaxID=398199 RepID=UPI0028ADF085|nr:glycosyltransferase family 2 protein [Proteiniclasticum ruminis]
MQHIIELLIVLLGIGMAPALYYRFPKIPGNEPLSEGCGRRKISVVIPARNEEENLPLLLEDLRKQCYENLEIIVVDDGSKDKTGEISKSFGVKVITISDKPSGWLGKTWACQKGAEASEGELLLFLDADVRVKPQAVERILKTYEKKRIPISVQPYHKTEKCYEQASLFFNLIQIGANGVSLKKPQNIGLYGPLILFSKEDYKTIGGHESVKENIVEDMALGRKLKEAKIPYDLYVGDDEISFRMYSGGFKSLLEGWTAHIMRKRWSL